MVTTDPKTQVDESPIVVSEIVVDGRRLAAREPLRFEVTLHEDEDGTLYVLEGDFGIRCYGESRSELGEVLQETLELYWSEFAQADPGELSPKAKELRGQLLERIAVGTDGA